MIDPNQVNFDKNSGLVPAIVQDADTKTVLMQAYMNKEALTITQESGKVTFYSRSRQKIWTKGETSGHCLQLKDVRLDCDGDCLLIQAIPMGPTCHTGTDTCWNQKNDTDGILFLNRLSSIIKNRKLNKNEGSYTSSLFDKGINKIAQKVGEEAVELVIEAKDNNDDLFLNEAADLLFHYLVLLEEKQFGLHDVVDILKKRHDK